MKQIKIGGYIIDIDYDDRLIANHGDVGQYSPVEQKITLAAGLTKQQEEETLIHEVLEAINDIYELGLEHDEQLCKLSVIAHQIITDNKDMEELKKCLSDKLIVKQTLENLEITVTKDNEVILSLVGNEAILKNGYEIAVKKLS